MLGIGGTELAIILVFGFLMFGPDKLPGLGRTLGKAIRQFREAEEGFTKVVQTELVEPIQAAATGTLDKNTKNTRNAKKAPSQEDLDADADIEDVLDEGIVAKESFAERKARMEAEHKKASAASLYDLDTKQEDADSSAGKGEGNKA